MDSVGHEFKISFTGLIKTMDAENNNSDNNLKEYQTLRRYIDLYKLFDVVSNKRLYFRRAWEFCKVDKFEGEYPEIFWSLSSHITITDNQTGESKSGEDNLELIKDDRLKSSYISCWNKSEQESMALWQIYGGNNSVFIETTVGKLRSVLDNPISLPNRNGKLANLDFGKSVVKVDYIGHKDKKIVQDASKFEHACFPMNLKHHGYTFEDEVRAICSLRNLSEKKEIDGVFFDINPLLFIDKIIVSPMADDNFFNTIKKLVELNTCESLNVKWSELKFSPHELLSS